MPPSLARRRILPTFLLVSTFAATAGAAPLQVVSVTPLRNTAAAAATSISVEFDQAVFPASIGPGSFRVFGRASGAKAGSYTLSNGDRTVTFQPTQPFSAGEIARVNLSHDIQATDLTFLRPAGYAYQFRIRVAPAQAQFQQIDVMSNRTNDVQTRIYGAAATDLDEDGYLDLATVNEVSADIRVFLNRADGSGLYHPFLDPQTIGVESSPNESADFNNDGHIDLAIAASSSSSVWVMSGAGDGTFSSSQEIPVGNEPHGVVVLDVDGDGDPDIVNANHGSNSLSLMINNGSGVFAAPSFIEGGVNGEYRLAAGDMNNDGIGDLVVAGNDGAELRVQLGNGDGTFTPAGPSEPSGGWTWVVVLDDVNGDGDLDATAANSFSNNGAVLLGDGAGGFGAPATVDMGAHTPSTDLGDMDGDGDTDWVLSSYGGGYWRLFMNDGAGNFSFAEEFMAPSNPSCSILCDIDNDGDLDMALTDEIADVVILMRNLDLVGVEDAAAGGRLTLLPNVPNPARAGTKLRFALPAAATVQVDVFDLGGRRVAGVAPSRRSVGVQEIYFDGRDAAGQSLRPGVYLYRVASEREQRFGKIVVAR